MKYSYLVYEPVPKLSDLSRIFKRVAQLGYHGIELVATHPLGVPIDEILALTREYQLPVVSLLSGWSYSNEGLCLSSADASVRERAAARLIDYVDHAARLGSVLVVGLMQGLRSDEPDETIANTRIAGALKQVAKAAEGKRVPVVIEPVNHQQVGFNNTAAEASAMATRVGSPALGYMLDTIHLNVEERSVPGAIREYGPKARHFHLCESNGGPYGSGGIDFPGVLAALREAKYGHFISVKIYRKVAGWDEAATGAAAYLRKIGAEMRA